MLTLAFDTSTRLGSVALGDGAGLVAETELPLGPAHSGTLLPEIDRLLADDRRSIADVEAIAVGGGPGSYTGVRIAASLAKGFCHARDIPLFAYSSLAAVVAGLPVEGRVCVAIDAGGERVYAATYSFTPAFREDTPPEATEIEPLLERLDPLDEWIFAGDGAARHENLIQARKGRLLTPRRASPRAAGLLWLAREVPGGRVGELDVWEPDYGRPPAATPFVAQPSPRLEKPAGRAPSFERKSR